MGSNYTSEGSLQAHDYSAFYALNVYKYGRIEWSPCSDAQLTWSAYRWSFYDTTTYTVPFVKACVQNIFQETLQYELHSGPILIAGERNTFFLSCFTDCLLLN
ncbi:hypothetical protein AcW1_009429 [Taiwanofungus camphoratus]|nr:hypothetical protein AcV5_003500 [Antrodia cinnamomea]KAI0934967.1 hypothetical protein AcV7_003892 [Antrodia cinnamomea]KAI0947746.1 hypothetical protein AcW1_009429 [Antrodia cinnamomea]